MLIDAHQHPFWHHKDDAGLVADMDEQGIDVAWLLTWEIPPDEGPSTYGSALNPLAMRTDGTHGGIPFPDIIKTRDRYPDRFIIGYCPYPKNGNAADLFEAAYHMHHVRLCGEWKFRMCFDDPRCLNLYRKAGELGCPVTLHLDIPFMKNDAGESVYQPHWYGGTVANLERALIECPGTNFLGHAPGFWREISGDADEATQGYPSGAVTPGGRLYRLFETYPNLYGDLSAGSAKGALSRDPEHAKTFITTFADRLLFARDYYGSDLNDFLKTLELPQDIMDKLYFKNAQKLVPLEGALKA